MAEASEAFRFNAERDLRILRDELYEGSWELMLRDLENRLSLKPPIYKITENIKQDIAAIEAIVASEREEAEKSQR